MKTAIDFLSLRPVWTRRGLEIIWYGYVAATLIVVCLHVYFLFAAIGSGWTKISEIDSLLFGLAHLALVRIFLELALKFLVGTPAGEIAP